jgi:hypothetical protein
VGQHRASDVCSEESHVRARPLPPRRQGGRRDRASSGLGVAFAQAFAEAGADVVLGARRVDRLPETGRLVEAAGRRYAHLQTDVTVPDQCTALVQKASTSSVASTCW